MNRFAAFSREELDAIMDGLMSEADLDEPEFEDRRRLAMQLIEEAAGRLRRGTPDVTAPIRPEEVPALKREQIPDVVFEAVNELIVREGARARITIDLEELVRLLKQKGLKESDLYANHWLDFEDAYRQAGWEVKYDQPGYNETGRSYYTFTDPSRKR